MGTPADVGASGSRRLDGYIRVSAVADRAGESFQSPGRQREAIARWAAATGVEIAAWHRDLDRSGGHLDRPGLVALLERIRSGYTNGVVVDSLDRLSRARVGDALHLCDEIREAGGRVVALDLVGAEQADPFGEFALTMMLALARLQWHGYAEHWALCREAAIRRGVHRYAVPYGYRRDTAGRLVVEPEEARIVREVFRRRRAGESSQAIRRWLDRAAPRDGGLVWAPNSARKMVANTAYLGVVRDGGFLNECAHEPVVDRDLWLSAQSPAGERPRRDPEVLLSGLVRCASCGHLMSGRRGRRRARLYLCGRQFASGRCPAPVAIAADRLEGEVARQLFDQLARLKLERSGLEARRKRAEASVRRAERAVAQLLAQDPEDPGATQRALRRREQLLKRAEGRRARLVQEASDPPPDADGLRDDWPTLPAPEKHELFAARLDAVLVRRATRHWTHVPAAERIRVLFTGEAPPGLRGVARTTQRWQWDERPGVRPVV